MRILLLVAWLFVMNGAITVFADSAPKPADGKTVPKTVNDQKSAIDGIKAMQHEVSVLFQSPAGRYAREFLDKSRTELQSAQLAAESGKIVQASRQMELAGILLQRANAVTAEQESGDKAVIKRAELKKLEERIDMLLKGKEQ
ncbi:MAG: hypothetical protein PHD54_14585 [Desulfuromonadaceae bacterium]|nr:hypothetical protein [Desulfuromonadaceae bacterium]